MASVIAISSNGVPLIRPPRENTNSNSFNVKSHLITDKEKQGIAELKERLGDLCTSRYNDIRICRFLRARDSNINLAETMIRNEMKWREEFKPDKIFQEFPKSEYFDTLTTYWPGEFHGVDKSGIPLYCERIGAVDPCSLMSKVPRNILIQFHIYTMELNDIILSESFEQSECPMGFIYVMDVTGLGWKHRSQQTIDILREISHIDDNYYPESLRKFFVLRVPKLFCFFWSIAKLMLNTKTIEKFVILKTSFQTELRDVVDSHNIPRYLGGTCCSCEYFENDCKKGGGDFKFL